MVTAQRPLPRGEKSQKIVVVVGPDMSGKTEIATALAKALDVPYYKQSSERSTFGNDQKDFIRQLRYGDMKLADFVRQTKASFVMDRGWPCEWTYAPIMGRETDLDVLDELDETYASMGAKVIVCTRSSYKGIVDDIDDKLRDEKLEQLAGRYRLFQEWTRCDSYMLNVDSENTHAQVEEILRFLYGL